jgi:hypothetical protein
MFTIVSGTFITKDRYLVPSMVTTLKKIYMLTAFYFLLAWYFDTVLASNRG